MKARFAMQGDPMELTARLRPTVATSMAPAPNLLLYCKLLALGRFDLDRAIADELADIPP